MDEDGVYDVPRSFQTPATPATQATPPSLPPKKSTKPASLKDLDGLSSSCPESRPKPMPRRTVRSSSSLSDRAVTSPTTPTQPTSPHSSTTTPTAAPRPVPRPRPRLTTKSPDPSSSEAQFAQNLPPTADEVEEHVNEMVRSKLALEEAEERRKQEAEKQNEWSTVQSSSRADLSSDHQDGGSCKFVNNKDVDASGGRGFYENSDIVQSSLRRSAESQMKQETQGSDLGHGQGWLEAAFGEPDSSGGEYAQVQKRTRGVPSAASEFETNFDPFVTIPTNQPGLPPVPVPGGSMLQPTKMWDNPGYACGAGQEAPDSVQSSGPSDSQRNSSEYEAVWFSERQKEDRPGMVRPHSQLMTFTPKPVEDRSAVQVCEPAYGERLELSRSVDSSDSSEDLYHERASSTGPLSIITPTQPRKNERYGYLYKQGGVRANRGWRMRWVVFNGKDLRYYDNNRSQISKKIIPLSSMKEVISDVREGDTNRFKFRLVTTLRDRTFLFAADTRDDCCTWTNTLMAAILENKADGANGEEEVSKPDKEGFIRFENNNKKFYVAIWGKTLCYYDSFEDFQMHCPVHEIDMKLSSVKDRKKNKLQLSTHYAHFSLVFDSHQEAQSWRMAIEDAIAEGLADDSQGTQFGSLSVLEKVYENDSNRICADCEDENPHWASINLGVVLCKKCAGIHRMFDSSISKIRSLRMDTRVWTPSLIELMKAVGNGNANLFWEHDLLPIQKIARDSLPEQRKTFAQLKYQSKRYSNQHPLAHDKRKLNEALLQVSSTNDLLEAMKIIFSGADLSFSGGPERENAYQTAKRHGQRLLMELLYQNGGDCSSLDEGSISDEGRLREDVRLQGYLMKTGPAGRTFDQRWCVLEHGALTYYINDKSTTAKDSIDRKTILCLQEISSEKQENAFEISTSKSGNRVYTFAAESLSERGMWMRTLGKLISPVAVMEHVGMMDFSLAALVFMRESVSEDWRQAWIMLSWRLLYFMDKDLKLDHVDLRKATQIKYCQTGACPMCMEKGRCFVLSAPGQTFYIQANLERDTSRILETVSVSMKQSGKSLLDQQLTADSVPVIVDKCLTQVLSRGQKEVGIYRKAATHSRVMSLIEELKKDAHAVRLDDFDIHEVANALKRFLRELEDSLFMRERYNEWIRTSLIDDDHNKFLWYRYLLEKLPLVNYNTLRRVVLHIWKMAQYEAQSKMNAQSFCTCFAPTLMRTESDPVQGNNPGHEIKVLMDLVFQRDYLFKIEQKELDHEAKIQAATQKIIAAQQDVRKSQPSSTFLMPVSMYSHNGQCEMVNVTPATSAQDVVDYLTRKCNLSGRTFALTEVLFKGALERPLFPSSNVLLTTGRWGDWDEAFRKEMCLCLTDTETLDKLDANYDNSRPLFGEVRYADSKSKTKFKKATVEFKQYVLTFYKDARARSQLCSWKVEELTIYLGIDSKRSPPNNFGFTFTVNNKEEKSRNSCFGHCVSLPSEEEMYRWVSALLVAQNPDGLRVWNK
ncbi:arf-GAP with Rho-GAP domain, ANK repeat and PH domain-containing protein 1-like isoform X4 [Babylonia areolata]|uniref:arf-GAP with Rho-GAP domain, ANK repeat and PH domain-containing protein 1-like isoform X4 n=1 Tax=Babylonia areolata TaxID=304850 RepID=UPI003FD44EE8